MPVLNDPDLYENDLADGAPRLRVGAKLVIPTSDIPVNDSDANEKLASIDAELVDVNETLTSIDAKLASTQNSINVAETSISSSISLVDFPEGDDKFSIFHDDDLTIVYVTGESTKTKGFPLRQGDSLDVYLQSDDNILYAYTDTGVTATLYVVGRDIK